MKPSNARQGRARDGIIVRRPHAVSLAVGLPGEAVQVVVKILP